MFVYMCIFLMEEIWWQFYHEKIFQSIKGFTAILNSWIELKEGVTCLPDDDWIYTSWFIKTSLIWLEYTWLSDCTISLSLSTTMHVSPKWYKHIEKQNLFFPYNLSWIWKRIPWIWKRIPHFNFQIIEMLLNAKRFV